MLERFRQDGFVNVGRLFEPAELDELRAEMDRYVDAAFFGRSTGVELPWGWRNHSEEPGEIIHQMVNLWEVSGPFRRAVSRPRIVRAAAELAGAADIQVWHDQTQYKPAQAGGENAWHQDAPYWSPLEPAIALTAWIALDDADVDNGCMWMVPGSHLWGDQMGELLARRERREPRMFGDLPRFEPPANAGEWQEPRPCVVKAGEVHFHHCLTWHGSSQNRANRPRRAFAVHYMPTGVRFTGETNHPLASRIRVERGKPMIEDSERFPVVYRNGRCVSLQAPLYPIERRTESTELREHE